MNFAESDYAEIFGPYAGKTVGYLRLYGNWGDQLIELGAMQLFKKFKIEVKVLNPQLEKIDHSLLTGVKTVFISGGGSLGKKYKPIYEQRRSLCSTFDGEIIVLPQSLTDEDDDNKYTHAWLREETSYNLYKNGPKGLCHDLAFHVNLDSFKTQKSIYKTGILCREDSESNGSSPLNLGDPVRLSRSLDEYIRLASCFDNILTDRLHFAIIAAKLGKSVSLISGNYHKINGIYNHSMKGFSNVEFFTSTSEAILRAK